jgi:hypothetical protein
MVKAQIQAQIFIYVMVLVVGAGILIYGYTAIKGFKAQADDVLELEFQNTLKNDLKSVSFESTKVKTYNLPAAVSQICFKAPNAVYAHVVDEEQRQEILKRNYKYPIIASEIQAETENNVFLYPRGEKAFFSGIPIDLTSGQVATQDEIYFKCFDVRQGILKIKIKGQGNSVLVTEG